MNKEKIMNHFGVAFYNKMLNDLKKYTEIWKLSNIEQIEYYSVNCIFKCISDKYGLCILKIGNPSKETETEANFLREYTNTKVCNLYEADIDNGILLIEQLTLGTQLRAEPDLDKRLDLFYKVSHGLHIKPANKAIYPTYMG